MTTPCSEADTLGKCIDRCTENADDSQVDYAASNCGKYDQCSLALCCAGFYYDESSKKRTCGS